MPEVKQGTKIQIKTKVTDSATAIPQLEQGEPLFNTNDNRFYIGPQGDTAQQPTAKTTFMPMQGKDDEYSITYDDDGYKVKSKKVTIEGQLNVTEDVYSTNFIGNASTATKFSSNRKIELTGNVTGSGTSNGESGWSIENTVVTNYSHQHSISNVDDLQSTLDSKALTPVADNTDTEYYVIIGGDSTSPTSLKYSLTNAVKVKPDEGKLLAKKFSASSDARLKENFQDLNTGNILELPVFKFDFIDGPKNQIGCKAQDLQKICPEIVDVDSDGYLSIQESKLVYLLLQEVKKLKQELNNLKNN